MEDSGDRSRSHRVLLWAARISAGIVVALLGFVIVVNFVVPNKEPLPTGWEWFGVAMFPFGVFVGYALTFRWRLAGAVVGLVCLLVWLAYVRFTPRVLPVAAVLAAPGVLHVLYSRAARGKETLP